MNAFTNGLQVRVAAKTLEAIDICSFELVAVDGVLPRLGRLEVERRAADLLGCLRASPGLADRGVQGPHAHAESLCLAFPLAVVLQRLELP